MEWMHLEPEPHTRENVKRYVTRRCIEKNDCNYCRQIMLKTPMEDVTANEKYIEYREYPNADEDAPTVTKLVRPTNLFINIIKTQLMAFNHSWQHHWASTQLLEKMINEVIMMSRSLKVSIATVSVGSPAGRIEAAIGSK
ncbi:uncharacterized protein LOC112588515 [Harpegnathos saltator]|uniref:uncharacterized protein LOC112588515 n=1 Tax=Harpegnathos saltator TaxID=610380 RepID=UPI000DBEEF41|nr:uncharacterized protein LOC112588515 [Harpegnathos saltator]